MVYYILSPNGGRFVLTIYYWAEMKFKSNKYFYTSQHGVLLQWRPMPPYITECCSATLSGTLLLTSVFTDVPEKPPEKQCTTQLFLARSKTHLETLFPKCSKPDQAFQIQINYQILCVDKQTLKCLCFNLTKEILASKANKLHAYDILHYNPP